MESLHKVLSKYETRRETPTEIGAVHMGLVEWSDLGQRLANANPARFLELLESLRRIVESVEREANEASAWSTIDIRKRD